MSNLNPLGFRPMPRRSAGDTTHLRIVRVSPLLRVLAFTGRSIDDVVNDPIVKREVLGYYKLQKWVTRGCEEVDMDRAGRARAQKRLAKVGR